jgi:rhodanese-related sulfurtransferase
MNNCLKSWLLTVWALALVMVICPWDSLAAPWSDSQKKQAVYQMYAGYKQDFPEVSDITPREAMRLLAQKEKVVLVDVRSPEEQQVSMLPGAVTREDFLRNLDHYRDHVIIGYCTISYRSGKLAQDLRQQGITMLNLQGGLLAWLHEGGGVYSQGVETRKVHVYGKKWDLAPARFQTVRYGMTLW